MDAAVGLAREALVPQPRRRQLAVRRVVPARVPLLVLVRVRLRVLALLRRAAPGLLVPALPQARARVVPVPAVPAAAEPAIREVIPEAKRPSREQLIETANYYFTGLARNDGKGYYPFTADCDRFENGVAMTQTNCKAQFENTLRGVVSRIRDRRFVAVDRERGIVFAFAFFDHENINWTWQLGELFKIENGQIRRIEAVFHRAPYGINSGWSTYEQGLSEEPQIIR